MSLMTDLATYVEAQSGITDILGATDTKFYPQIAKGGVSLPYTIYYRPANRRNPSNSGSSGLKTTTIRMVHFAKTYGGADALAEAFRAELDGFPRGSWGSTFIHQCRLDDESDSLEPLEFAQNDAPHFISQEYAVTYKETVPSFS